MKKVKHGILTNADMGRCPSCHELMALPVGLDLDALCFCPTCKAQSYGFKWLADTGSAAAIRMETMRRRMAELDNMKVKGVNNGHN